jgi:hypothetical protein
MYIPGVQVLAKNPERHRLGDRLTDGKVLTDLGSVLVLLKVFERTCTRDSFQSFHDLRRKNRVKARPTLSSQVLETFGR